MNRTSRLTYAVLFLAVVVASPALPQTGRGEGPRAISFGEALRGFVPSFLLQLWDDVGCSADPLGGVCRQVATPRIKQSLTVLRAEEGCGSDPLGGRCTSVPQATAGTGH
jgi:hypothetical protein